MEIAADNNDEDNENFTIALSGEVNASVASADKRQITGTIQDDDDPPVASIVDHSAPEASGDNTMRGADGLVVTLVRLQPKQLE